MNMLLYIQTIIMGLVEGITEFLPISSTGHLILTAQLLDFWTVEKRELFEVAVQIGAILAVIYQYWGKLWGAFTGLFKSGAQSKRLGINLIIATIPALLLGLLFGNAIKAHLFNAMTVATTMLLGGILILWLEKHKPIAISQNVENITLKQAIAIGFIQCLALIPGTSRSGATIIGALMLGVSRTAAAEFSFFLGIPILMGAGFLDLFKARHSITTADLGILLLGMTVAFVSALFVIRALIQYVSKHNFTVFAWYRIIFGCIVLLTAHFNLVDW